MANIKPPIPLEDIVLSSAQGFWPLAPGWWILIILAVVAISWVAYGLIKKLRYQYFYRKQLKIIDSLENHLRKEQLNSQEMFKVLNRILKLYLIHYAKDDEVISLSGNSFRVWLENKSTINPALNPIFDNSIYQQNFTNPGDSSKSALMALNQFRILLQNLDVLFKQQQDSLA